MNLRKILYQFIVGSAIVLSCLPAYAASKATNIEFLLSQVRNSVGNLAGGTVTVAAAGDATSTPITIWLDRNKATPAANPYTLDANGTAQLYADGLIKVVLKNSAGTTVYTRDNLNYVDYQTSGAYQAIDADYASLNAAIAAIGSTPTTLTIRTASFSTTGAYVVPATLALKIEYPGSIANSTNAGTINGPFSAGNYQVFTGSGTVTGLKEARPEWFGAKRDATTDDTVALQAAINTGAFVKLSPGHYKKTDALTFPVNHPGMGGIAGVGTGAVSSYIDDYANGTNGINLLGASNQIVLSGFNMYDLGGNAAKGIYTSRAIQGDKLIVSGYGGNNLELHYISSSESPYFSNIRDSQFNHSRTANGLYLYAGANGNIFTNCQFQQNALDGVLFFGGDSNTIIGGQSSYNGHNGYNFTSALYTKTFGIYTEGNGVGYYGLAADANTHYSDFNTSTLSGGYSIASLTDNALKVGSSIISYPQSGTSGTWTPVITFGGASTGITYTTQTGTWTYLPNNKIFVEGSILLSSKGSATGVAKIAGLPVPESSVAIPGTISVGYITDFAASVANAQGYVIPNTSTIQLTLISAGASVFMLDTSFTATSYIIFSGIYTY